MDSIKVKKDDLLVKLRENRAKHQEIFDDAVIGYREKVIGWLDERLKQAQRGTIPNMVFALPQPMNQTKDYDRAIAMLEMSVEDVVELDERNFQQYVQDEWSWKQSFTTANSTYTSKAY